MSVKQSFDFNKLLSTWRGWVALTCVGVVALGAMSYLVLAPTAPKRQLKPAPPGKISVAQNAGSVQLSLPGQAPVSLQNLDSAFIGQGGAGTILEVTNGTSIVSLADGSGLFMDKSTRLEVLDIADPSQELLATDIVVQRGAVMVQVRLTGSQTFVFHTPAGTTAQIFGTLIGARYDETSQKMIVDCLDGTCRVNGSNGHGSLDLQQCQQAYVLPNAEPVGIFPADVAFWHNLFPEYAPSDPNCTRPFDLLQLPTLIPNLGNPFLPGGTPTGQATSGGTTIKTGGGTFGTGGTTTAGTGSTTSGETGGGHDGGSKTGGATAGTSTAGTSTAGTSTAGTSTAGTSTAGTSTAGTSTAGTSTAGTSTAGTTDAGTSTAGTSTAGTIDAGTSTAGTTDAGTSTAGTSTAGTTDAGTSTAGTSTAGTDTSGTSTAGTSTAGTDTSGTSTAGTSTAGTDTSGTSTAGTSTAGTDTSGTSTAGTSTAGTDTSGTSTAGTSTSGTDTSGTSTSGTSTSGTATNGSTTDNSGSTGATTDNSGSTTDNSGSGGGNTNPDPGATTAGVNILGLFPGLTGNELTDILIVSVLVGGVALFIVAAGRND